MAQTKAVAKAAKLDLAVLAGDSKDASGFGNLDMSRDVMIPYINILQTTSPQLNPSKAEHVEGAKVGQFYNCLLYTSPSPRDGLLSRMPSSA